MIKKKAASRTRLLLVKMIYIIDYQCFALYASNLNA